MERLSDWTNDMLSRLRMGFKAGTSEMLDEYRTRLHVNASEHAHVMTSAMWGSITRLKSFHHSTEGPPVARDGTRKRGKRENVKEEIARFQLIRKVIRPHDDKKIMLPELDIQGLFGWRQYVFQRWVLPLCPEELGYTGGRPYDPRD